MNIYVLVNAATKEIAAMFATEDEANSFLAEPTDGNVYVKQRHCVAI